MADETFFRALSLVVVGDAKTRSPFAYFPRPCHSRLMCTERLRD